MAEIQVTPSSTLQAPSTPEGGQRDSVSEANGPSPTSASVLDPAVDDIFSEMTAEPVDLDEEFEADAKSLLHRDTHDLLKYLGRKNCFQFFRQSLFQCGMPRWSRWTVKNRESVQKTYFELAADPMEIDNIVRRLQGGIPKYGRSRLLRMTATILGTIAWMQMETDNE